MSEFLRVGMIGTHFMGRVHSNAWRSAPTFFDLPRPIVMEVVVGLEREQVRTFAKQWGWDGASTDWRATVARSPIDLVDICTPNDLHAEHSIAALEAGRHVLCEKPLAGTLDDARAMRDAARKAKRRGVRAIVSFNYRRCPALAFAHQLVKSGRLGRIYHVRAHYLQDWGGPDTPLLWRFKSRHAGSGAHGDLNAHIIDAARFVTGDEISEVSGAIEETFIKERPLPPEEQRKGGKRTGRSSVDDALLFLARFKGGAVASFEASRLATGHQNRNVIELNGEKGSLRFDFERMNELEWWDDTLDPGLRGWSRIMCTTPGAHPYVDAYWPPAHLIGYEHTFISQAADIVKSIGGGEPVVPLADFADGFETQRVLHAAVLSARERRPVKLSEVK